MDKNKLIQILEEIKKYDYYDQNTIAGNAKIKYPVATPILKEWKQLISFTTKDGKNCEIDLIGRFNETKVISLNWRNFTNEELELISKVFDLKLDKAKYSEETNNLIAKIDNTNFQSDAMVTIRKSSNSNHCFLTIFYYDDGESRKNPQLYVHGIWEVQLSDEFIKKMI